MKALKVLLGALLTVSITINIYQYNQLQNMQSHYNNQKTDILVMSEQIADYKSLLEGEEKAIVELEAAISELKETADMFIQEKQELEKQLEELMQEKATEEIDSEAYLVEKMPEKPAETPAPPSQPSQSSSGGSLSKDDIMSKLGGLGANGGMGGMTNGGQASADAGGAAAGVILQ